MHLDTPLWIVILKGSQIWCYIELWSNLCSLQEENKEAAIHILHISCLNIFLSSLVLRNESRSMNLQVENSLLCKTYSFHELKLFDWSGRFCRFCNHHLYICTLFLLFPLPSFLFWKEKKKKEERLLTGKFRWCRLISYYSIANASYIGPYPTLVCGNLDGGVVVTSLIFWLKGTSNQFNKDELLLLGNYLKKILMTSHGNQRFLSWIGVVWIIGRSRKWAQRKLSWVVRQGIRRIEHERRRIGRTEFGANILTQKRHLYSL